MTSTILRISFLTASKAIYKKENPSIGFSLDKLILFF